MDQVLAEKIARFFDGFPARSFSKGQVIIHAHEDPTHVFRLVEGRVKQCDISPGGDEIVLNTFKPPAFFPMSYAINRTPNLYSFKTEAESELRLAPVNEAVGFLKANPDVTFDLLARVYRGTDGLLGRLAHLMAGTARSRVLYALLIECRRFGEPRGAGMAVALTESDLAAHAGLTRETVSREIRKLKQEDLISVIKNEIFVNRVERLAESVSLEL